MSKIEWDDSLLLGVKEIDEQHQQLVKIANSLLAAIADEEKEPVLSKALSWLREYTVFHFNSEEEYMEQIGYPKRSEHAQQHLELKENVKTFQKMLYRKEAVEVSKIKNLLYEWLVGHIIDSDMAIARYLKENNGGSGA
ncbi:bacteriohemerythrin [Pseudodesulfovibrio sp.]|nr:bacteriohemerythrin [Pseudodesulfovibrio sp.]